MKTASLILLLFISLTGYSQSLPDFSFKTSEGVQLTKASLKPGKPVIVIYFDPYSAPCITQAETIKKSLNKFTQTTIIWASWAEIKELKEFKAAHFPNAKNMIVAKDDLFKFDAWFGYSETPTVLVYTSIWKLSAKFAKETSAEDLLNAIKKSM